MNTKRSLLICVAAFTMLIRVPHADADNVILTLDLKNNLPANALSGGFWTLFARKVETGTAVQGDLGISDVRAFIDNIDIASIVFDPLITNVGAAPIARTPPSLIEINYTPSPSIVGFGVNANPNLDRMIACGTWPAGPRPVFGNHLGLSSEAKFLPSSTAAVTLTSIVTLGDLNNSVTVTNADIAPFVASLTGAAPYNPAADINQSGTISNIDIAPFVAILTGTTIPGWLQSTIVAVPEPASLNLILLSGLALAGRASRKRRPANMF